jgi:hypothetical protein
MLSVVVAISLVMMPAAWHRIVEPHQVSRRTVSISSKLICVALFPLALGLALDIYVVVFTVINSNAWSAISGASTAVLLLGLWFVIPASCRKASRR